MAKATDTVKTYWLLFVCRNSRGLHPYAANGSSWCLQCVIDWGRRRRRKWTWTSKGQAHGETPLPKDVTEEEKESPSFNHLLISNTQLWVSLCPLFKWAQSLTLLYWPLSSFTLLTTVFLRFIDCCLDSWALTYYLQTPFKGLLRSRTTVLQE